MLPETLYGMDTNFSSPLGRYPVEARCAILKELGYGGAYESLGKGFDDAAPARLARAAAAVGLPVSALYFTADLSLPDRGWADLRRLIERAEGTDTIELAVHASEGVPARPDPVLHDRLTDLLHRALEHADRHGRRLLLYPHIWFYIERLEQAVAVARDIGHPRLGVVFTAFHWYAVDGTRLRTRLTEAAPFLRHANICGSRRLPAGTKGLPATIECLDDGELDNAAVLAVLADVGYAGPVGLQGYSNGGDPYLKLERSLAAYRSIRRRVLRSTEFAAHVRD